MGASRLLKTTNGMIQDNLKQMPFAYN